MILINCYIYKLSKYLYSFEFCSVFVQYPNLYFGRKSNLAKKGEMGRDKFMLSEMMER